jgi:hypothetical protein
MISLIIFNNFFFFFFLIKKSFFVLFKKKKNVFLYQFRRYRVNIFKDRKINFSHKHTKLLLNKKDFNNFFEFDYFLLSGFIIYNDNFVINYQKFRQNNNIYIYKNYN